jgi:quercetin dioxygenase-like cupin family protein
MTRIAMVFTAVLLVFALPALAQDPTVVDPDHYNVEFENDDVRVLRITYGPGEKSVMHTHPEAIVVLLTDGKMVMHLPDGEAVEYVDVARETSWTPAVKHMPENVSDTKMEAILIEMKDDDDD